MKKTVKTFLKSAAKDYVARSVNPPIVRASTILFKTMQELRKHQKDIAKRKKSVAKKKAPKSRSAKVIRFRCKNK